MLQPIIMDVSSKGAVIIPVKLRKYFGIEPKGKVMFVPKPDKNTMELVKIEKDPIEFLSGFLKGQTKYFSTKALLKERRKDLEIDERQYARNSI